MKEKLPEVNEIDMRSHEEISEHEEQTNRESKGPGTILKNGEQKRGFKAIEEIADLNSEWETYGESADSTPTQDFNDSGEYGESTIPKDTPSNVKEKILELMRKADETGLPEYKGGGVYHTDGSSDTETNIPDVQEKDTEYGYGHGGKRTTPSSIWKSFQRVLAKKNPDAHAVSTGEYVLDGNKKQLLSHRNKVTGTLFNEYMASSPDRKDTKIDPKKARSFLDDQNMN